MPDLTKQEVEKIESEAEKLFGNYETTSLQGRQSYSLYKKIVAAERVKTKELFELAEECENVFRWQTNGRDYIADILLRLRKAISDYKTNNPIMDEHQLPPVSQSAGVWRKASEGLPNKKRYYITRRPTVMHDGWIVEDAPFNPKYNDTYLHKWMNFGLEWLDDESPVSQPQPQQGNVDECRQILQELVYLKSIKDIPDYTEEYERRKPLAWAAAKKYLGQPQLPREGASPLDAVQFAEWLRENYIVGTTELWRDTKKIHNQYTTEELYKLFRKERGASPLPDEWIKDAFIKLLERYKRVYKLAEMQPEDYRSEVVINAEKAIKYLEASPPISGTNEK